MYPIPPTENLVSTKTCRHCSAPFPITDKDVEMLAKLAPKVGSNTFELPTPDACPNCRKIRLLAWRNESKLYKRKCDATGKDIISHFPPNTPFKVYEEKVWNSDIWDAKTFGRDFDFSRPFFEQFSELQKEIPRPATSKSPPMENSDYTNNCGKLKDCYLCFNAQNLDSCLYCIDTWYSDYCVNCYCTYNSQVCFECTLAYDSYHVQYSYDVKNCRNSSFLLSCEGCSDCYGCFGLVNRKHCIYNAQYSPEEYQKELETILSFPIGEQENRFGTFHAGKYDKKSLPNTGSEDAVESSNAIDCKNIFRARNVRGCEDVRYGSVLYTTKTAMDFYVWWNHAERIYSSHQVGNNAQGIYCSISCWDDVHDLYYSYFCMNGIHDCFGCIGLKDRDAYCILNKQYTKEEYAALVPKIIEHMQNTGEWGRMIPAAFSPHGYNETIATVLSPLSKDEAIRQWFNWSDYEAPFPKVEKIIPASKLPEDISKIPDDILNWAIECEVTKRPFRIVRQELEFYRKYNLPIPRQHPEQRHLEQLKWHVNY